MKNTSDDLSLTNQSIVHISYNRQAVWVISRESWSDMGGEKGASCLPPFPTPEGGCKACGKAKIRAIVASDAEPT